MSILPVICVMVGIHSLRIGVRYDRSVWKREHPIPEKLVETDSYTLQPESSRWIKFVFTTGLCLLLNGTALSTFLSDGVVVIPCVLGGLLMVLPALYNGLAMINPRVTVTLSSDTVQSGGHVELCSKRAAAHSGLLSQQD